MRSTHRVTSYVSISTFSKYWLFSNPTLRWPFFSINATFSVISLLFSLYRLSSCTRLLSHNLMIVLLAISMNEVMPIFTPQMDPLIHCLASHMRYYLFSQFIEVIFIQVQTQILNRCHILRFVGCQFGKRNFPYFDEVYESRISNINILCPPLSISVLLIDCFHCD